MRSGTSPVKIREKGPDGVSVEKVVNNATFAIYETVDEAVSALGDDQLLVLLNTQVKTNELNRVRELARNGPGKKAMEREALQWIQDNWTAENWQAVAGIQGGLLAAIEKKAAELTAERKAASPTPEAGEDESV